MVRLRRAKGRRCRQRRRVGVLRCRTVAAGGVPATAGQALSALCRRAERHRWRRVGAGCRAIACTRASGSANRCSGSAARGAVSCAGAGAGQRRACRLRTCREVGASDARRAGTALPAKI